MIGVILLIFVVGILGQMTRLVEGLVVLRRHQGVVTILPVESVLTRAVSGIVLIVERASDTRASSQHRVASIRVVLTRQSGGCSRDKVAAWHKLRATVHLTAIVAVQIG